MTSVGVTGLARRRRPRTRRGSRLHVVVAGLGVSGFAAADALQHLGAQVTVVDDRADADEPGDRRPCWRSSASTCGWARARATQLPDDDRPGRHVAGLAAVTRRSSPEPRRAGLPVWGDVELAWRLRDPEHRTPWLCLTGTNGKTTTVQMLDAMLRADGLTSRRRRQRRPAAVRGRDGPRAVRRRRRRALVAPAALVALAVRRRPRRCSTSRPTTSPGTATSSATPRPRPRSTTHCQRRLRLQRRGPGDPRRWSRRPRSSRAAGRSASPWASPRSGMLGVVDDVLADRAFIEGRERNAAELARVSDVPTGAPHNVANALAAAALARAHGVAAGVGATGAAGLHARPRTGSSEVAVVDGVAVRRRLQGDQPACRAGLAARVRRRRLGRRRSGQGCDVRRARQRQPDRLRGAVLLGADRERDRGSALATRAGCPRDRGRRHRHWGDGARRRRRGVACPARATRCCWRRPARRSTCSRTTPHAATRSPRRSRLRRDADPSSIEDGRTRRPATRRAHGGRPRPAKSRLARCRQATGSLASLKRTLDKPLTSYHLVLGVSGLLLALGLLMVLSASSVSSLREYGNSYAIFMRQAMWVAVGLPLAWVASRLPRGLIRGPVLAGADHLRAALIAATYIPRVGVDVNGNRNWISVRRAVPDPAVGVRASSRWCSGCADVYARKGRLLGQWRHLLVPMVPVCLVVVGPRHRAGRPRHRAGAVRDRARHAVGGRSADPAVRRARSSSSPWPPSRSPAPSASGSRGSPASLDPMADYGGSGWQASHGFFALATGGLWGRGIGASNQKWGGLPEAHTDYIFAIIGEEFGLFGTLVVLGLFVDAGVRRHPDRGPHEGPVRPVRVGRDRRVAARPGADQHRYGARPAAGHRDPAAADLVRRLGPAADPGRARSADVVRAHRAGCQAALRARTAVGRTHRPRRSANRLVAA